LITLALAVDPVLAADLSRLCGSSVWESVRASVGECLRTWYAATDAHHKQCALAAMLATGSADFADVLAPLLSDEDQQIRLSTYRAGDVFYIPPASVPIGGASLTAGAQSAASILFTRECSHWLALLAEAYRDTGQPEKGLRLIAEALDHVAQTGIVYYEAELHRLDAELRLRLDTPDEQRAEVSFRRALETAGRQQAKSRELRAATSLARLWGERGRQTEARELLAPVYGWFTEGFDTRDLRLVHRRV
jgi:hypothetical protein